MRNTHVEMRSPLFVVTSKMYSHVPNTQVSLWQCWLNTAKLSLGLLLIFKRSFVESCLTLTLLLMCYSLDQVDWFESTVLLLLFCLLEQDTLLSQCLPSPRYIVCLDGCLKLGGKPPLIWHPIQGESGQTTRYY